MIIINEFLCACENYLFTRKAMPGGAGARAAAQIAKEAAIGTAGVSNLDFEGQMGLLEPRALKVFVGDCRALPFRLCPCLFLQYAIFRCR